MAITENQRITVKVCQLYYEDNLSQKEISSKLGISRPQISRILANARSNNIVTIKINNPFSDETVLEKTLIKKYNLKDALVFNTNGISGENVLSELGAYAAEQLDVYIPENSKVGVMSGKTISHIAKAIKYFDRNGLEFIPLIGGMGSGGADWHANLIAQSFSEKSKGRYCLLNAPVLVKNKESRDILLSEPEIYNVLERGKKCDVAIVGIGQVSEKSTSVKAGALNVEEIENLRKLGAVASVCASYLDEDGKIIENDITDRSIGQTLNDIKNSKVIAIAVGNSKVDPIRAVLNGGYIDIFITNIDTALEIIK